MTGTISCKQQENWLALVQHAIDDQGFALLEGVMDQDFVTATRAALVETRERIQDDIGEETLAQAAVSGYSDLPLLLKYHDHCLRLLELPEVLAIVEAVLGPAAIVRFMNGYIIESITDSPGHSLFDQNTFHMNYKQVLNGYRASLDCAFYVDAGTEDGVRMGVVPGTQQRMARPSTAHLEQAELELVIKPGTMLVMDSTLWHREHFNRSDHRWIFVGLQLAQPFIKQHIDLVRALGEDRVRSLPARTRRLIGWEARVPASLQEFYCSPEERLYRAPWMIGMADPPD